MIFLLAYGIKQLQKKEPAPVATTSSILTNQLLENLQVEHLPNATASNQDPFGTIGLTSFWIKPAEQLNVKVSLQKPTRFFVVLLKSPGDMQLVHPPSDQADSLIPKASPGLETILHIDEPTANPEIPHCLGVMLVTLKEPLTFDQWSGTLGQTAAHNWLPLRSKECWFYQDGEFFDARSRGTTPSAKTVAAAPAKLVSFCQAVQENEGTRQVQVVTVPVLPSHVGSRD